MKRTQANHSNLTSPSSSHLPLSEKIFPLDWLRISADPPQRFLPSATRCLVTALMLMAFDTATLQDTLSALAGGLSIS